jgi:hypothetical protein
MPRTRRKSDHCLNCGYVFHNEENYCPECGQENNNKTVSVRVLASELAEEALNLDSRVFKSIIPFFLKPGFLALEFNAGKRVSYVAPLRLYLLASFLYFLSMSLVSGGDEFVKGLDAGITASEEKKTDSLKTAKPDTLKNKNGHVSFGGKKFFWDAIKENTTPKALVDSSGLEPTFFNLLAAKQLIRIANKGKEQYIDAVRDNLSVMLFLLIPAMAWILKILYWRRRVLFVQHFVFVMYTQAFVFLSLTLSFLLDSVSDWGLWLLLIIPVYIFMSMRRMYGQSKRKTALKMFLFSWVFLFLFLIFLLLDLLVAFFLF